MTNETDPYTQAQALAYMQRNRDNMILYQLDTTEELKKLMNNLLGRSFDEDTEQYNDDPLLEPVINKKGAQVLMSFLEPRISKISTLSKLSDEEIRNITYHFSEDLVFLIGRYKDQFGFKSDQAASSVINLFDDLFFTSLKKADKAHQSDSINKNFSYVEHSGRQHITEDRPKQQLFTNPLK